VKITTAKLELYRNTIEETMLQDTCTIQTRTWVADDMGGGSYTWADAATSVPCRLIPRGILNREEISGGKITIHDTFVLAVHWDRSIDETMRVVFSGDTFEVTHVDDVQTERLCRWADVARIR